MTDVDRRLAGLIQRKQTYSSADRYLCRMEGILPLVAAMAESPSEELRAACHEASTAELIHRRVMDRCLRQLSEQGIRYLVFKGAALAYQVYQQPWQRTRSDTDILVHPDDREKLFGLLEEMGFASQFAIPGELVKCEQAFVFLDDLQMQHILDVHWRVNNHWFLSGVVSFESLWHRRIVVPGFDDQLFSPGLADSLLISSLHRAAHMTYPSYEYEDVVRLESDYVIWLYDIHLLANLMTQDDWRLITNKAVESGAGNLVADALMTTQRLFETKLSDTILQTLQTGPQVSVATFQHPLRRELRSIRSIPSLTLLFGSLRELLFPAQHYMRSRYGSESWLPMLYLRRLFGGFGHRIGQ